jgi:hypothetical protein
MIGSKNCLSQTAGHLVIFGFGSISGSRHGQGMLFELFESQVSETGCISGGVRLLSWLSSFLGIW